jgi:hypothetical protein
MESDLNPFVRLASINVNDRVEKKNGLSYLSWAWAVDQLLRMHPGAQWSFKWFGDKPYLEGGHGVMVFCTVSIGENTRTAFLPVMDNRNNAIAQPDMRDINDTMQRCLVKAIALHGLGLYIYAGEDLPRTEQAPAEPVAGETEAQPKAPVTAHPTRAVATPAQIRFIERLIAERGSELQTVLDYFRVNALSELSSQAASRAISSLQQQRSAA